MKYRRPRTEVVAHGRRTADRNELHRLGDVGTALLLTAAVLVGSAQIAGVFGFRPLAEPTTGRALALLLGGVAIGAYVWLGRVQEGLMGPQSGERTARWATFLAFSPAVLMVAYAIAARFMREATRVEWFLGGDHVRHLVMTAEEQSVGFLSYANEAYPRAWHTGLALLWSTFGLDPSSNIAAVIDVTAFAVWLLSAGFAFTTSALAVGLAQRAGLGHRSAAVTGFLAGCIVLWPLFLANYQALGLEASVVAACVLAVVLRDQLRDLGSVRALAVAAAGCVVLAHTWQLLFPVTAAAAAVSAVAYIRRGRMRGGLAVLALLIVSLAACWPALVAVVTRVGVGHAAVADIRSPVPWAFLLLGVLASLAVARPASWGTRWVLLLMALPAVTGLALAAAVGVTPDTYYPSKLLWHSACLMLAPLSVEVVLLARRVDNSAQVGSSVARVLGGAGLALVLIYALVGPAAAFWGAWSTTDGATVLHLLSAPRAGEAQVVWSRGPEITDTVTRILLDAVDPRQGESRTPQESLDVDQECMLLRQSPTAAVLSDQPLVSVRARYACAPDVRVIQP